MRDGKYIGNLTDKQIKIIEQVRKLEVIPGLKNIIYDYPPELVDKAYNEGQAIEIEGEEEGGEEEEKPKGELTDVQTVGVGFMYFSKHSLLGDGTGTGKTVQLPLDFQLFGSFPVVPSAFQDRFGHHEKNTVYETVTRTLALDQFAQNLLLDGTDNGDVRTSDKNGTLRTLAIGNRRLGIEHRKPELFFRAVIVAVEILEPGRQFVRPKAEPSGILCMYQAQSFGSDIRNKKAAAHGSLRKLIQTGFQAFLLTHGHSAFILGIQLLIFLILTIVVFNKRLESETQRMTLIGSRATNQCHVQNGTFQSPQQ